MAIFAEGLLVQDYFGVSPEFSSPPAHIGIGASVVGRVSIGAGALLGDRTIVRADGHYVRIGENLCLGQEGTIHIAHELYPTNIGDNVTAGRNAVIHACDVGSNCFLGDKVIILDGSKISPNCAFEDDAIVFPGTELEGGWLYGGRPAKPIRPITSAEIVALSAKSRKRINSDSKIDSIPESTKQREFQFLAATARLSGFVSGDKGSSVWYGCILSGEGFGIDIGKNSNVQDNSIVRSGRRKVAIGKVTTIGHNVTLMDCAVGDRCLIGIGSVLSAGTIVQDDVLLAAGAHTSPGQILESGWLYGGRPAQKIKEMDDNKRRLIELSSDVYVDYARNFSEAAERFLFAQ